MLKGSEYVKIRVTVPQANLDEVIEVLGKAGAGKMGNYDYCSFAYPVEGKFRPLAGANPAIGRVGQLETVEEICLETICHQDILESVILALKKVHPYEEPAIDIMPLLKI